MPLICFDTAYINNYIQKVKKSTIVVNVSNDSWFGESSGPHQHFQIVRSRAKEINRWILRSTASGISGFIDNNGKILVSILPILTLAWLYKLKSFGKSFILLKSPSDSNDIPENMLKTQLQVKK